MDDKKVALILDSTPIDEITLADYEQQKMQAMVNEQQRNMMINSFEMAAIAIPDTLPPEQQLMLAQLSNPAISLMDCVNKTITVVAMAWKPDLRRDADGTVLIDEASGEVQTGMRSLLLGPDGTVYSAMSPIVYGFCRERVTQFGNPPTPVGGVLRFPLMVAVELTPTKKGRRAFKLKVVTA